MGCDNTMDGRTMKRGSALVQTMAISVHFTIPSTIGPMFNKRICDREEPSDKFSPLSVKNHVTTFDDDF